MVNVTVTVPGSSILGLPSTTFYGIVIVLIIAAVGVAVYFTRFRKKPAVVNPATKRVPKKS